MHWNVKIIALFQFIVIVKFYGVDNLLSDIQLMLRLRRQGGVIGPTGYLIKHLWTWICPVIILLSLLLDTFSPQPTKERAKKVGDSIFWHLISILSISPLLSFLYYLFKRDRSAFRSDKWRSLKMPIDESTISNSALPQPAADLETICVVRQTELLHSTSTYNVKKPYKEYCVDFVLNEYVLGQSVLNQSNLALPISLHQTPQLLS